MIEANDGLNKENNLYVEYFDDDSTEYDEMKIENSSKLKRTLDIKKYDRMIKDIILSVEDESIILTPEYQRNYLWDNKKSSKLIESILLNIPIPVIYAAEEQNGKWNIVDGLQRLNTLKRFYNDEFRLTGLEVLSELNGKKYTSLSDNLKSKIDRGDLSIILLLDSSSPDIQYDIFMRLNTGAVQLNEQELRNCLYRGSLNDLVKNEMIYNDDFKALFNLNILHKRMIDVEIILRYLAFSENYNEELNVIENYDGRIKNIINSFMIKYQNTDNDTLDRFKNKFYDNIKKCNEIFKDKAFKKVNSLGRFETRINRPLYETIMICFEKYSKDQLINNKSTILYETECLLKDAEFNDLISTATGNTTKTNKRIQMYSKLLKEIMEHD